MEIRQFRPITVINVIFRILAKGYAIRVAPIADRITHPDQSAFIQPSTPRGPVQPPLHGHPSTVYCSSNPPHHGVLFNHPSTVYCSSSPPEHGVLFIHPSTGTPPPSTVHPSLHHTTGSCSSRGNATAHCSSKPPRNTHYSSHRSASISSSSEGIAPSGSVNSHRSVAWVQ